MSKYVKHQHSKRLGYLEYRREISDVSYHFKYSGKILSSCLIRECGSTLYVGLARTVPPTNTNFRLTFLLTRLQEALYEDLAV